MEVENEPNASSQLSVYRSKFKGVIFGMEVLISNRNMITTIRKMGPYGSFKIQDSNIFAKIEKLFLAPEEAYFLAVKKDILEVYNHKNEVLTAKQLWSIFSENVEFVFKYAAFEHYSDSNWNVKLSSKFGGFLILYDKNPNIRQSFVVYLEVIGKLKIIYPYLFPENSVLTLTAHQKDLEPLNKQIIVLVFDWPEEYNPKNGLFQFKKWELQLINSD